MAMKRLNSEPLASQKPKKRLYLSISEQRKQRFSLTTKEEVQSFQKGVVPRQYQVSERVGARKSAEMVF